MAGLSLLDAFALLFVIFRITRAREKPLGESLHALIALLLIVGLFLGFRMTSEVRDLLGEAVTLLQAIPGLGTKLLVILCAWYVMRLLRSRSGYWIESGIPKNQHARIVPVTEGLRAALAVGFVAWLAEGLFDDHSPDTPWLVQGVRLGDAWIEAALQ